MSAETDKTRDTFTDLLTGFDDRLHATTDDVEMLTEIQESIRSLLETATNEAEIRKVLQERYAAGTLRQETFQLVKSMLDHYISENVPTSPTQSVILANKKKPAVEKVDNPPPAKSEDTFGTTTVIPVSPASNSSTETPVQVGSVLRDRFLLQQKVSGGSMGVVYKALDRRLAEAGSAEQWVAIKVLSPMLAENGQALRALQQEAAKGRCLVHPHIVRFLDLDRDDELYFLVMEWLEGRTLASILDSNDRTSIDHEAAFRIVSQIGEALDYAHRCGIVHADIKPGNIMIMPNGDAKLFDFGIARVRQAQSESEFDPGVLGAITPAYSSMQVLTGDEPTAADDVFSLACLLYRLIAGYRVFGPRNAAEASQEGMSPQILQAVTDAQWRAVKKALSFARVTRFQTIAEFLQALQDKSADSISVVAPQRNLPTRERSGSGRSALLLFVLALVLGGGAYQYGYLDAVKERFDAYVNRDPVIVDIETPARVEDEVMAVPEMTEEAVVASEPGDDEMKIDDADFSQIDLPKNEADVVGPSVSLVDFSRLPEPTLIVPVAAAGRASETTDVALREDGAPVIVDFVRDGDLSRAMTLRLEEVGFSGNRSPWAAGQYAFSNSGMVHFPAGQPRARVTLTMASDPLREADQQSTLRLRDLEYPKSNHAVLNVTLQDDDQRSFEARLPVNTIAFASSQASIRESDPVVQIDVIRFNPDRSSAVAGFEVNDITAVEGQDYFAPGGNSITFGPGQRSARLLIPLVQDADTEGDEAFVIELSGVPSTSDTDVFQRIVVMIRDDEPQTR